METMNDLKLAKNKGRPRFFASELTMYSCGIVSYTCVIHEERRNGIGGKKKRKDTWR